jgi:hypothetical protein
MHIGSVLLIVWLIMGAVAAGRWHYFNGSGTNCAKTGTIIVTIIAGPLNYTGVNPKISCKTPQPMQNTPAKQMSAGRSRARSSACG